MKLFYLYVLMLWPLHAAELSTPLFYSYQSDTGGGIGVLECVLPEGRELRHRSLWSHSGMDSMKKVSGSENGKYVVAAFEDVKDERNVVVVDMQGQSQFYSFGGKISHLDFYENQVFVGTTDGALHRLDPERGEATAEWDFRKLLQPSGRRPESFFFDDVHHVLWVSFQKDSDSRKHLGSRIVGIDLKSDAIIADLRLPRDKPALHYDPAVNGRESGPNPEVLFVDAASNTLFVTLDLYGAVAMMDLDGALQGELKNYTVHSTAMDGSWGTAFPDRVGAFPVAGACMLVVANASEAGGAVLVNLQTRELSQRLPVPGGLTTLQWIPQAARMVSGVPGKIKSRGSEGILKRNAPQNSWYQFELQGGTSALNVIEVPQAGPVHRVASVDLASSPLVFLNLGAQAEEWQVIHPAEVHARASIKAFGKVIRTSR